MEIKKNRRLKVYGQRNGYNYQEVPTIVLKGKWLKDAGFDIGTDIMVECENGRITVRILNKSEALMDSGK